ncbi:hypothetical protein V8C37DRAFT_413329 [Trichoderma ceciliae]
MPRKARPRSKRICPKYGSAHEDKVGRPMVRFLLITYSKEQIQRLFKEESRSLSKSTPSSSSSPLDNDGFSIFPELELQVASPNTACMINTMPSPSNTSGNGASKSNNVTLPDSYSAQQREEMATCMEQTSSTPANQPFQNAEDAAVQESSPVWQNEYACGLCIEQDLNTKFSRKNDLKRHLERKHHTNNLWICSQSDCSKVFQWLGAYKDHIRSCHAGSGIRIWEAKVVTLCPQTVFACGFEGCVKVFEAPSGLETAPTKKKFINHIINHFRFMKGSKEWTFTFRIRNLLRQVDLINVWPPPTLSLEERVHLQWDAQTGSVLQKLLETRHLGDIESLIQNIVALGSNPSKEVQLAQANIAVPVLGECLADTCVHRNDELSVQYTAPMMGSGNAGYRPNYMDIANGGYQQQPLIYRDPVQEMLDSLMITREEQQFISARGYTDPMEWITYDVEGNGPFM